MLGVDACAEADFDSRTEGLEVGDSGDTRIVDFTLKQASVRRSLQNQVEGGD